MKYLVIKNGYVIDSVEWDGVGNWTYPNDHDAILMKPVSSSAGIGDWYEESEDRYMRYVDATVFGLPEDAPPSLANEFNPNKFGK